VNWFERNLPYLCFLAAMVLYVALPWQLDESSSGWILIVMLWLIVYAAAVTIKERIVTKK